MNMVLLRQIMVILCLGQSKEFLDYLLDRITKPKHFRERANALHVLFFITDKYGMEDKIRQVLFDFIQKADDEEYGRYIAIETLGELHLNNESILKHGVNTCFRNLI